MSKKQLEIFRLEDRVLFEAAAAAEIVEAQENDPNANMNQADQQAQDAKNAIKNAPPENPSEAAMAPDAAPQPDQVADIDAEIQALIEGEIGFSDAMNDAVNGLLNEFGANAVSDAIDDAFATDETLSVTANSEINISVGSQPELMVINYTVQDMDQIINSLGANQEVLILESGRDAMEQINDYLNASGQEYSAIHIVSHGNAGYITLGGERYDASNFDAADWAAIGEHLTVDGDIMFYGCNLAQDEAGRDFIAMVADASGADVAASTDSTGINGNWILEYNHGEINTVAISVEGYSGSLTAAETFTEFADAVNSAATSIEVRGSFSFDYTITIDHNLAIIGDGSQYVLSAGSSNLMFSITDGTVSFSNLAFDGETNAQIMEISSTANVTLNGVAMQNGSAVSGGAIYSEGSLSVNNSTFTGNIAEEMGGAIYASGELNIGGNSSFNGNSVVQPQSSHISTYGGAVYAAGDLNITGSVSFTNNKVESSGSQDGYGGAIYVGGTGTISGATFTGNTADDQVAGNPRGRGGAIYGDGSLTINNSVFSGNIAAYEGGAIYANSVLQVIGSEFYGNSSGNGGALALTDATLVKDSIFGKADLTEGNSALNGGAIGIRGPEARVIDLTIDGSEFYGNNTSFPLHESDGGAIYIYSTLAQATLNITGNSRFEGNYNTVGEFSPNGGAIYMYAGKAGANIEVNINGNTQFVNNSSEGSGGAIFLSTASSTSSLILNVATEAGSEVTFDGNRTNSGYGGGIHMSGNGMVTANIGTGGKAVFTNQVASAGGGALYMTGLTTGSIELTIGGGSEFRENYGASAGAIYAVAETSTNITIGESGGDSVVFDKNRATGSLYASEGGAIMAAGTVTIYNTEFTENTAAANGGAITLLYTGSILNVYDSLFSMNEALNGVGGAIQSKSMAQIGVYGDSTFEYNKSVSDGGAIYARSSIAGAAITIGNGGTVQFIGNDATGNGGAIYAEGSKGIALTVNGGTSFSENKAARGGAIHIYNSSDTAALNLTVNAGSFTDNMARSTGGGAIFLDSVGLLSVNIGSAAGTTLFDGNTAWKGTGGAIHMYSKYNLNMALNGVTTFSDNHAGSSGGAIYAYIFDDALIDIGTLAGSQVSFSENTSGSAGGAIWTDVGSMDMTIGAGTTFTDNTAISAGALQVYGYYSSMLRIGETVGDKVIFSGNRALGNGSTAGEGGAIYATGKVTVTNSTFSLNNAEANGGAIYAEGELIVSGSTFAENSAATDSEFAAVTAGGAIYAKGAVTLATSTFTGNYASATGGDGTAETARGGAIYAESSLTVNADVSFAANHAYAWNSSDLTVGEIIAEGGAIYALGTVQFNSPVTFTDNYAEAMGYALADTTTISAARGGAIYAAADITLTNLTFTSNHARSSGANSSAYGGAVYAAANATLNGGFFGLDGDADTGNYVQRMVGVPSSDGGTAYGGGIYIAGTGNVNGTHFTGNKAMTGGNTKLDAAGGAIYAAGPLTVSGLTLFSENSVIQPNVGGAVYGGAIYAAGDLTITGSVRFEYNKLVSGGSQNAYGGAIYVGGTGTISGATFTGNTADYAVGGNPNGKGGAIYGNAELIISDSVFNNNVSYNEGGAIYANGELTLTRGEFYGNHSDDGGALLINDVTTIVDSKFGSATAGTANYALNGGAIATRAETLKNDLTIIGSSFIGNYAERNGGAISFSDNTLTEWKLSITDSEFINNKVTETTNTNRGRGGAIYVASVVDNAVITIDINGKTDFTGNTALTGGAIYVANMLAPSSHSTANLNIGTKDGSEVTFTGNIANITGQGAGGGAISIANIMGDTTIDIGTGVGSTVSFVENKAAYGGAINADNGYAGDTVTMTIGAGSSFYRNEATEGHGGAINVRGGADATVTIGEDGSSEPKVYFEGNKARYEGGAVRTDGTVKIYDSIFHLNEAGRNGGAMSQNGNALTLEVKGSTFTQNTAGENGGAIEVRGGTQVDITSSTFSKNTAKQGGALYVESSTALVTVNLGSSIGKTVFNENTATLNGGAVFTTTANETLNIINADFTDNKAGSTTVKGLGGAVYAVSTGALSMNVGGIGGAVLFDGNEASHNGGGMYLKSGTAATLNIANATFKENASTVYGNYGSGGAFMLTAGTTMDVNIGGVAGGNVLFDKNSAIYYGAAAYLVGGSGAMNVNVGKAGTVSFTGNDISGGWNGGAIAATSSGGKMTFDINGTFTGNKAGDGGGALWINAKGASTDIDLKLAGTYSNNIAGNGDGGAVWVNGTSNITANINGTFSGNKANTNGAAIWIKGLGEAKNIDVTLAGKYTTNTTNGNYGGGGALGVYTDKAGSAINVTAKANTEFTGNFASYGGAIYAVNEGGGAMVTVKAGASFTTNSGWDGGAIYVRGTGIANSIVNIGEAGGAVVAFSGNSVYWGGGAVWTWGHVTTVNANFVSNSAGQDGGAIFSGYGKVDITNSNFGGATSILGNKARNGGAIYLGGSLSNYTSTITDSTFQNNSAVIVNYEGAEGGAIWSGVKNTLNVTGSTFDGNSAGKYGGAIYALGTLTVRNSAAKRSEFYRNHAGITGGAIYANATATVSGAKFGDAATAGSGNSADVHGGAIYANGALTVQMDAAGKRSEFYRNTASAGGAINGDVGSSVTVTDAIFGDAATAGSGNSTDTSGGAIYTVDALTVSRSVFYYNTTGSSGGAIFAFGDAKIDNSVFGYNTAGSSGGAIFTCDSMTIHDSTFHHNNATGAGGGIFNASNSVVTVYNSTLYNNASGAGGGIYNMGTMTLADVTLAANHSSLGGGIFQGDGKSYVYNTLLLANYLGSDVTALNDIQVDGGTFNMAYSIYQAANITLDGNGNTKPEMADPLANIFGAKWNDAKTELVLIADGANVLRADGTIAIMNTGLAAYSGTLVGRIGSDYFYRDGNTWKSFSSAATHTFNTTGPTFGLTGGTIINLGQNLPSSRIDTHIAYNVGAYVIQLTPELPSVVVTTDSDVINPFDLEISLREAIEVYAGNTYSGTYIDSITRLGETVSNYTVGTDITFNIIWGGQTLTVILDSANGTITIGKNITVNGMDAVANAPVTVQTEAGATHRLFTANNTAMDWTLGFSNLILNGGTLDNADGGVMLLNGKSLNLTFDNVEFNDATARNGGALYLGVTSASTVTITDSIFDGNTAKNDGGGIYTKGAITLNITDTDMTGNHAGTDGGGIYMNTGAVVTLNRGEFSGNSAVRDGGGVFAYLGSNLTVNGTAFTSNDARHGGAIAGTGNASSTTITLNGAVIGGSSANGNTAVQGAGVYVWADTFLFIQNNTEISYNTATEFGGGVALLFGATANFSSGVVKNNDGGGMGGGFYMAGMKDNGIEYRPVLNLTGGIVGGADGAGNRASTGGGIYMSYSELNVSNNSAISYNSAVSNVGGGVWAVGSSVVNLTSGQISYNKAGSSAGGIGVNVNSKVTVNSGFTIGYNTAGGNGGGIYAAESSTVTLSGGTVTANTAKDGGGIYLTTSSSLGMTSGTISDNIASRHGGGIHLVYLTTASITGGAITGNFAGTDVGNSSLASATGGNGGGIYCEETLTLSNITISNNTARGIASDTSVGRGGGTYSFDNVDVTNVVFDNNTAMVRGGAIFTGTNATISGNSSFTGNSVIQPTAGIPVYAGAVYANKNLTITGTAVFTNNKVVSNGSENAYGGAISVGGVGTISGATFTGNTANQAIAGNPNGKGGAIYGNGKLIISDSVFNNNVSYNEGGAIYAKGELQLTRAEFYGNNSGWGGAILINDIATIIDSTFGKDNDPTKANYALEGGAIATRAETLVNDLTISGSSFFGNYAERNGGAISLGNNARLDRTLNITDSKFIGNYVTYAGTDTTYGNGGAIYVIGNETGAVINININGTTDFTGNTAKDGGAISVAGYLAPGAQTTANINVGTAANSVVTFTGNIATMTGGNTGGGAISASKIMGGTTINIGTGAGSKVTFTENKGAHGGAIYADNGYAGDTVEMTIGAGTSFYRNEATDGYGGAVSAYGASGTTVTIGEMGGDKVHFEGNTAKYDGGAVRANDIVEIYNSTFHDNHAGRNGGAVALFGTVAAVTVEGSTFTENTAVANGGAIEVRGGSQVDIISTTFSKNTANQGGALYLDNSAAATMNLGDGSSTGGVIFDRNTSTSNGGAVYAYTTGSGNLTLNIVNGEFTNNKAGSSTVNAKGGAVYAVSGGALSVSVGSATGDVLFDTNTASHSGGAMYLKAGTAAALDIANAAFNNNASTVYGYYGEGGAIMLTAGTTMDVNIGGVAGGTVGFDNNSAIWHGAALYLVGGTGAMNVNVGKAGSVSFTNNDIGGGWSGGAIAATSSGGKMTFNINGTFTNNEAGSDGGAIWIESKGASTDVELSLAGTYTNNNSWGSDGGAVWVHSEKAGTLAVTVKAGTKFTGNTAIYEGGAIHAVNTGGSATVTVKEGASFTNNKADTAGAIYLRASGVDNSQVYLGETGGSAVRFDGNQARYWDGGAIWTWGHITAVNTDFVSNSAGRNGGAIFTEYGTVNITGGSFGGTTVALGNKATNGGAIYLNNGWAGTSTISGTLFQNNTATTGDGGAIWLGELGTLNVTGANFDSNKAAANGGAIYAAGTLTVGSSAAKRSEFYRNSAVSNGGAIYADATATVSVNGAKFGDATTAGSGNTATNSGGAIYAKGAVTVGSSGNDRSEFYRNVATLGSGGAIYGESTVAVTGAKFGDAVTADSGNTTSYGGGAIYALGALTVGSDDNYRSEFYRNSAITGGGAIFGYSTVAVTGAKFGDAATADSGNSAFYGGAIYAYGALTVGSSDNDRSEFYRNSATKYGGAIYGGVVTVTGAKFGDAAADGSGNSTRTNTGDRGGAICASNVLTVGSDATYRSEFYRNSSNDGGAIYGDSTVAITGAIFGNATTAGSGNTASSFGGAICAKGVLTVGSSATNRSEFYRNTAGDGGAVYGLSSVTVTGAKFGDAATVGSGNSAIRFGGAIYSTFKLTVDSDATNRNEFYRNNAGTDGGALYGDSIATVTGAKFGDAATTGSGNSAGRDGGAFYANNTTAITGADFAGNIAGRNGGAIYKSTSGTFTISDSTVTGNFAGSATTTTASTTGGSGGGIWSAVSLTIDSSVTVSNNTARKNSTGAGGLGGGIYGSGTVTLNGATMSGNHADVNGGAVYGKGKVSVTDGTFTGNSADNNGGAIYGEGAVDVTRGVFTGNSALNGGAVYANGELMITHSEFRRNSALADGGAVYAAGAKVDMDNTLIADGSAVGNGGGIYLGDAAVAAVLTNLTIVSNAAADGGGIFTAGGNVLLLNSILWGNTVNQYAGLNNANVFNSGIQGWGFNDYATQGNVNLQAKNAKTDSSKNENATGEYYVCFVDADNGDYRLDTGSYAINRGSNSYVVMPETDLDKNSRIDKGIVDMGAYESAHKGNVVVGGTGTHLIYGESAYLTGSDDGYGGGGYSFTSRDTSSVIVDKTTGKATAVWADETVTIDVEYNGDDNWNSRTTQVTVTTEQRDLVIKATDATYTYDGSSHNLNWNGDTSGYVLDDALESWYNAAYRNAGVYENGQVISDAVITSSTRGDVSSNYRIAYEGTLTINQAKLVITGDSGSFTYDGTYHDFGYGKNGLATGDYIYSIVDGENSYRNAGTYSNLQSDAVIYDANGEDMSGNYDIVYNTGTVTVGKASLTITSDSGSFTYDGTYHDFGYGKNGLVSGDYIYSIVDGENSYRNAGSYTNTQSDAVVYNANGEDMSGNYDIVYDAGTVTVGKASLTITSDSGSFTYDGTYHDYAYGKNGLVIGDYIYSIINGENSYRNAGSYTNTQSDAVVYNANGEDMSGNYEITYDAGTVTVGKATLTITSDSDNRDYDAQYHNYTYGKDGLVVGDYIYAIVNGENSYRNAGSYTNTQSDAVVYNADGEDMSGNYEIVYADGTVVINKVTLTITAGSDHFTYDSQTHSYSWVDQDGLQGGDKITSATSNSFRNAGTYDNVLTNATVMNDEGTDASGNYIIKFVDGTVIIDKASLVINRDGSDKVYDGTTDADYDWKFDVKPFEGDDVDYDKGTASFGDKNVGDDKPITIDGDKVRGRDLGNYDVTFNDTTGSITPARLIIVIDDKAKTEGEADPKFTWTDNILDGDSVSGIDRTNKGETAGKYGIDQYQVNDGNGGKNYSVEVHYGTLTITANITGESRINIYMDASSRNYVINGMDEASLIHNVMSYTANREADAVLDTETSGNHHGVSHQSATKAGEKAKSNLREDSQKKMFEEVDQQVVRQRTNLALKTDMFSEKDGKSSIVESQYKVSNSKSNAKVVVPVSEYSSQNTSFESDNPMHTMPSDITIESTGVNVVNFHSVDLADVVWTEKVDNLKDKLDIILEEMIIV